MFLILVYVLLCLINSRLGFPDSKYVLIKRIEHLVKWRQGVIHYIEDNNMTPKNLFDVYSYCSDNKKDVDLHLTILPIASLEESLLKKDMILENREVFCENIDYEIVHSKNKWFVREKKAYPRYFGESEFLMVDSKCNIYEHSLKELGVTIENQSDNK